MLAMRLPRPMSVSSSSRVRLQTPGGLQELEVMSVRYPAPAEEAGH